MASSATGTGGPPAPNQGGGGGTTTMPDLVGSLAEQVRAFSDETLACALYQLSLPRPGLESRIDLMGTFSHPPRAAPGHVEACLYLNKNVNFLPMVHVAFPWPCRSQAALRHLLEEVMWDPSSRYFLVFRRPFQVWPPPKQMPVPDFGQNFGKNTGYALRNQLWADLNRLFPCSAGWFVKVLYMEEWEKKDNPVFFSSFDEARGWCRRMGAACAETVHAMLAE